MSRPQPEADRATALAAVFDTYGHVVPRKVTVGAQLVMRTERTVTGVEERDVKTTVKAAVDAKYKVAAVSASMAFEDGEGRTTSAQDLVESISFRAIGGRVERTSNPDQWAASVADPNRWAIIDRGALEPLVDRLDPDLKRRVCQVWGEHLHALWGETVPAGYVLPDMAGRPFTMARGAVLRPQPVPGRAAGTADRSLLANALPRGLGWRLEYRGMTTSSQGHGQPLYRIVEYVDDDLAAERRTAIARARAKNQAVERATGLAGTEPIPAEQVVLAAVTVNSRWYAGSLRADEVDAPEDSPASWTLTPVDPDPSDDDGYARAYVVKNHKTGLVLGPPGSHRVGRGAAAQSSVSLVPDPSPGTSAVTDDAPVAWMLTPQ